MTFVVRLVWRRTTNSENFVVRLILARTANETKIIQQGPPLAGHHRARAGCHYPPPPDLQSPPDLQAPREGGKLGLEGASHHRCGCQTSIALGTPLGLHRVGEDDKEARQRPRVAARCVPPPQDLAPRQQILCLRRIVLQEEGAVAPLEERLTTGRGCAGVDGVGRRELSGAAGAPTFGRRHDRREHRPVAAVVATGSGAGDRRGWWRRRGGRGCRREPSAAVGSTELRPPPRPPDLAPGEEEGGGTSAPVREGKRRWGTERRCGVGVRIWRTAKIMLTKSKFHIENTKLSNGLK
jgi:hypothetical protein